MKIEFLAPFIRQINQLAAVSRGFEPLERIEQDCALLDAIEGAAKWVAHREIDEYCARRLDLRADVTSGGNHDGWNSRFFEHPGDQTDGLMIERSCGHERGGVHPFFLELARQRGRRFVDHRRAGIDAAHKAAVVMRRNRAD